jgi:hypothetical protein
MKKLSFLVGKWSGDASVLRGPGEPIKVKQSEDVQYKLDGLLLVVEGTGRDPQSGKVVFNALGIINYDETKGVYRFRAYNDGRYLETDMKVGDKSFEWGFNFGPATTRYVMRINEKGEWIETGEAVVGTSPPRKIVEMTLQPQR